MSAPIPRFLLPRGHILPYVQLPRVVNPPCRTLPTYRNASASTTKPRVLEKPKRFNPPSHGRRLKQEVPRNYGPQLTVEQKTEQATKKYPHMMPPPGTWMYWFLTTTSIHTFITLGVLIGLSAIVSYERWQRAVEFRARLPSYDEVLAHPLSSAHQLWYVWATNKTRMSVENQAQRTRNVDDVQKRNSYRIAHGTMELDDVSLGPWKPKDELERARLEETYRRPVGVEPGSEFEAQRAGSNEAERPIHEREPRKKRNVKWLGIWGAI